MFFFDMSFPFEDLETFFGQIQILFGRGLLLLDKTMKNHHGGVLEAKEYSSNSVFKFDPDLPNATF